MIIRKAINLASRSNMNYDEFNWAWDPDANDPTVYEYDKDQLKEQLIQLKKMQTHLQLT